MKEHFLTYEQSLAVKELGFDEPCFTYYYNDSKIRTGLSIHINNGWTYKGTKKQETTLAPLKSQFFKWVREKYGYNCFITSSCKDGMWYYFREDLSDRNNDSEPELTPKFDTFEQAEDACINKIIELLKLK